ncbi:MAG: AI-2E family transporter [Gemmataceae bacterium]
MEHPRWLSYSIVFIVLTTVVFILGVILYDNALYLVKRMPTYEKRIAKINEEFSRAIGLKSLAPQTETSNGEEQEQSGTDKNETQQVVITPKKESSVLNALGLNTEEPGKLLVESTISVTELAVMVLFYLVFMVLEARNLPRRINSRFSTSKANRYMQIGENINRNVHQYLVYKTYVSLGLGVTTWLLCALFAVPFGLVWGVLMFLGNYITYIGSIVALIPPIALALLEANDLSFLGFQTPILGLVVALLLTANRFLWIDYVEIRFLGKYLNVSPLLLLFSIAFFGYLWGVVGMLLAVPLVTTSKIVLSHFENTQDYAILMSEE